MLWLLQLSLAQGCDGADPETGSETREALERTGDDALRRDEAGEADLYASDRILEVDLTLDDSDWDTIRSEGRSTNEVYSGCLDPAFEYTTVPASVRIDGRHFSRVGLRKKGFLGSLSVVKPSLRVDFNAFDPRQTLQGQKDLTLNNSRSDPSLVHQCLAFGLFAAAGIPSPRCSFAHVTKNGEDLGVYVNLEPMKKPFLRRHFRNSDGDLYEGSLGADFRRPNLVRFEKKTNERDPDISALIRVSDALESDDAMLLEKLEPLVDLEQFMRFWAMETLTGHYNGFTGSLNNFMVYHDPARGKLVFLPWGTDGAFTRTNTFLPSGRRPAATYAWSRLAGRLYAYEPTRRRYHEVLRTLLDEVWIEPALVAEVNRMAELLGRSASRSGLESLRGFIVMRRADIERELAEPDVPWSIGDRPFTVCTPEKNTPIRATFATTWGAEATINPETTLTVTLDGKPQTFQTVRVTAGARVHASGRVDPPVLSLVGQLENGGSVMLRFDLRAAPPSKPRAVAMHGFETSGELTAWRGNRTRSLGYVGKGKLVFEQASMAPGAPIVGRFDGEFLQTRDSRLAPVPGVAAPNESSPESR